MTKWVLGSLVVLAVALVGIVVHYTWINVEVAELSRLRGENLALAAKARAYEENAGRLQTRVLTLQNMVTKLGLMAGVEERLPESGLGGVGGVSRLDATAPSLDIAASLQDMDQDDQLPHQEVEPAPGDLRGPGRSPGVDPSIWPVRGYFSDKFGNRKDPFTECRTFTLASTSRPPRGTKVLAPADGVVTYRGRRGAYGNTIVIDHGFRHRHPLRSSGRLRGPSGSAGAARRRDRLRGQHRALDGAPPALRGVGRRSAPEPHQVHPGRVPLARLAARHPLYNQAFGHRRVFQSRTVVGMLILSQT